MIKLISFILILFLLFDILLASVCKNDRNCYGTELCIRLKQNQIKYRDISKSICFNEKLSFFMGTDKPIFKFDG